jgi:hypothetical protein
MSFISAFRSSAGVLICGCNIHGHINFQFCLWQKENGPAGYDGRGEPQRSIATTYDGPTLFHQSVTLCWNDVTHLGAMSNSLSMGNSYGRALLFLRLSNLYFQFHSLCARETFKQAPRLENVLTAPIELAVNFFIRPVWVVME